MLDSLSIVGPKDAADLAVGAGRRFMRLGFAGFTVLLSALLALTSACKQRALNDRSQADAVTGVSGGRAHFLWPVLRKRSASVKDLDVCWYGANVPLPAGAGADYRFPVSDVRRLFESASTIPPTGARYIPLQQYQKEAEGPGRAAAFKFVGTGAICSAAALGPVGSTLGKALAKQSLKPGKMGIVVASAGAVLCGASFLRLLTSSPKTDQTMEDTGVFNDMERYLKAAFNEDYRIDEREFQALEKAIWSVVKRTPPAVVSSPEACPQPADALRTIELALNAEAPPSTAPPAGPGASP